MITQEQVFERIRPVKDPEIGLSVVDLGLIYSVDIKDDMVTIKMTLTSPGCPYGPQIISAVKSVASGIEGVKSAGIDLVWSPPWNPYTMCSEDAKMQLGIFDLDGDDDDDDDKESGFKAGSDAEIR